ncbi:RNA polymerase sigma factor [Salinisphaera sp. PC39]
MIDYVTPITGCRSRAEDVVQDAYFRFVPDETERPPAESAAYLYRIVRNLALDLVRRLSMEKRHREANSATWLIPAETPDPAQLTLQRSQLRQVAGILRDLPERNRVALEMHRFGGFTLEGIAAHLDVSVPTAHRLIRQALLRIAEDLDADPGDTRTR